MVIFCLTLLGCGKPKTEIKQEAPQDLNELKARIDDLNNRVYVLTEQLETLKSQPAAASTAVDVPAVKKHKRTATIKGTASTPSDQEKEYSAAYELFKSGQ